MMNIAPKLAAILLWGKNYRCISCSPFVASHPKTHELEHQLVSYNKTDSSSSQNELSRQKTPDPDVLELGRATNLPEHSSGSVHETRGEDGVGNQHQDGREAVLANKLKTMMTSRLSARLTKAGYGLVGNHSAVKVCRWTKKQLQGYGGCYKHTFYGIESHRCMETTTFLACANRCVFCWRHHTHPVAKDFSRWSPDRPEQLIETAISTHRAMVKPLKGLKGATMERYQEALNPAHCALSLVGEPIVYPYINELVQLLHEKKISSFLVTNGQHPDAIEMLTVPVTQLYVSIDAPNPDILKKIGRPLFKDYWERLRESLWHLSQRTERTVARLTIVNRWNDLDVEGYAELIKSGQPDFIEVKAFTYPGPSPSIKNADLSIRNCPSEKDIVRFSRQLMETLNETPQYSNGETGAEETINNSMRRSRSKLWDIASIHLHSNSVLLASLDYRCPPVTISSSIHERDEINYSGETRDYQWNNWIDFGQFHKLATRSREEVDILEKDNGNRSQRKTISLDKSMKFDMFERKEAVPAFSTRIASQYMYPSPHWTLPESPLGGFDPQFDSQRWTDQLRNRRSHAP